MKKLKNEWKVFLSMAAFRTEMIHAEEYEDNITVGGEERSYGNNADHRVNALADAYDQLKKAYEDQRGITLDTAFVVKSVLDKYKHTDLSQIKDDKILRELRDLYLKYDQEQSSARCDTNILRQYYNRAVNLYDSRSLTPESYEKLKIAISKVKKMAEREEGNLIEVTDLELIIKNALDDLKQSDEALLARKEVDGLIEEMKDLRDSENHMEMEGQIIGLISQQRNLHLKPFQLADIDIMKLNIKEVLETLKSDTAYTEYYYQPYPIEITYDSHERWMPETHYYYGTWNTYIR